MHCSKASSVNKVCGHTHTKHTRKTLHPLFKLLDRNTPTSHEHKTHNSKRSLSQLHASGLWTHHTKHTRKIMQYSHVCRPRSRHQPITHTHNHTTRSSVQTAVLKWHHTLKAQNLSHTENSVKLPY